MSKPTLREVEEFSTKVEDIVWDKDVSYMEAIIIYCEQSGMEPEIAGKLISPAIKESIRIEAEELNFIQKTKKVVFS